MAEIKKKGDKKYLVRVYLGRDSAGRVQYHNKTIRGTWKDARDYANKKEIEVSTGQFVAPSSLTLSEYLDRWLVDACQHRVSPNTYEQYGEMLKRYVKPMLGEMRLSHIRPLDVQRLYNSLLERVSGRTVRYVHSVLSSALKQAAKWRLLQQNPAMFVDLPKRERKEMLAVSSEQARVFLEEAVKSKHFGLFAFVLETGMRPSEYLALQRSDVDFERGVVTVKRTLIFQRDGSHYYGEPKTGKSRRSIPLSKELLDILKQHLSRQAEQRLKAGGMYQDVGLLFAGRYGEPLREHNLIVRHFKPILKRAGLPLSIRLYDLRHSCATILLEAGVHPKIVADRLGHSSITLTLDTYSHVFPSLQLKTSQTIAEMIFQKQKKKSG